MLSSQGEPTDAEAIGRQVPSTTQTKWEQELNREQIFWLIENILSFEACLYHQVLPFRLEDNSLLLGIVNPQDNEALDYVSRILSYMNYIMVTQLITSETHRTLLSEYLNYKNTLLPSAQPATQSEATLTQGGRGEWGGKGDGGMGGDFSSPASPASPASSAVPTAPFLKAPSTDNTASSLRDLTVLQMPDLERFSPIEELTTLPPRKLLEELLARVVAGGIGRLYLERQPYHGRILWSENGVLQSVLETLPLSVFQGVLNELKRIASLPITTLTEPKQVEKECLYQKKRLLLRLRVMPGMYGEQGTLQVLRGAALKFYQQQQLARLSRDALGISKQLSYKLHELQERLLLVQDGKPGQLETFTALKQLLDNLDHQIQVLIETSEQPVNK